MKGWVGFDLDGTLAVYDRWHGIDHIGQPVPAMCNYVRALLKAGVEVRIVTARCDEGEDAINTVKDWCFKQFGQRLEVTAHKDMSMVALFDDRAYSVEKNMGIITTQFAPSAKELAVKVVGHWKGPEAPPQ